MLMPTMPVYLTEELGIGKSEVGIALSSYTIGVLCVRPFSGYLVDCFSRKPLYLFAFTLFGIFFFGYFFTALGLLLLIRFLQGGFMGLTSAARNTITIDVIPSERRGEGMGFYGLTINLAMSLAPLVAVAAYALMAFHPSSGFVWVFPWLAYFRFCSFSIQPVNSQASGLFTRPVHFPCRCFLYINSHTLWHAYLVCRIVWKRNRNR